MGRWDVLPSTHDQVSHPPHPQSSEHPTPIPPNRNWPPIAQPVPQLHQVTAGGFFHSYIPMEPSMGAT